MIYLFAHYGTFFAVKTKNQYLVKGAMDAFVKKELDAFSQVVDLIYKGAVDPFAWNNIVPALADYMESSKAMLFTPTTFVDQGGFYFNHGITETAMDLWRTRYQPMDVWLSNGLAKNCFVEGNTFLGEELVPRDELVNSVWYKEFLSQIGIGQLIANVVFGTDSKLPSFTSFSFFRSLEEKTFDVKDKYKSSLILPHVSRALGVMVRLRNAECQNATTLTALDRLNQGILLLNENGEVSFINKAALQILYQDNGLSLKSGNGNTDQAMLYASKANVQEKLDRAIQEVIKPDITIARHFSKTVVIENAKGKQTYTLNFSPLPPVNSFAVSLHPPKAIVFISDQNSPLKVNKELLKKVYGLTRTEIQVVIEIISGKTIEEISKNTQVSANTTKTHLKHIYSKTSTNSRVELIRLLIGISEKSN